MRFMEGLLRDLRPGSMFAIDDLQLKRVASLVAEHASGITPDRWQNSNLWLEDERGDRSVSQYFALGNSINFGYWQLDDRDQLSYCRGMKKGLEARGSTYMWRCLKVCVDEGIFPILDARKLTDVTLDDLKRIFQDDDGIVRLPYLEERLVNWRDLGHTLCKDWRGEFYNLVESCGGSLTKFAQHSGRFRAFDDPLCKMTMVNAIMHQGRGVVRFAESPMPAIDYQLVKQLLRQGVIVPQSEASGKLKMYRLLSKDEARELRSASLVAFAKIMESTGVPGDIIDNMWWKNGRRCDDEQPVCQIEGRQDECPFLSACLKRIEYRIPLEHTRYY